MRVTLWLEELRDDIKFAFRQLLAAPAFTLVAALTLALGIGANSAIFALVDATLLRPLPYADPERLVTIWETSDATRRGASRRRRTCSTGRRAAARSRTIAGFTPSVGSMVMAGRDGNAETVSRQWVTAGIFDVLGVTPIAGRTFSAEDEAEAAPRRRDQRGLWENALQSRSRRSSAASSSSTASCGPSSASCRRNFEILGRTSDVGDAAVPSTCRRARAAPYQLQVVGRMKPGVAIEAAQADLAGGRRRPGARVPGVQQGPQRDARADARHDDRQRSEDDVDAVSRRRRLRAADLLRERRQPAAGARHRARRASWRCARRSAPAAGASSGSCSPKAWCCRSIGGALGIGVGAAILQVAPVLIPDGLLPATVTLAFDMRVVAFCAVAALIVGVVFGIAPALQATAVLADRSDGRRQPHHHRRRRHACAVCS